MRFPKIKHRKFLVTGGAGFIGSHICEELVKLGKEVVCLDSLIAGSLGNMCGWWNPMLCTFVHASVCDSDWIPRHLKGVEIVFHQAAGKNTVCREDPYRDLITNAWGSLNVFRESYAAGVKKVVHASTGSVFKGEPKSFYGVSKLAGESYLRAFQNYYPDFKFTAIRYHHVYGPRQNSGDDGGVIPIFIRRILEGKPITIFGDGSQKRYFTYVKDVVKANFIASRADVSRTNYINFGNITPITIKDLAYLLFDLMGTSVPIRYEDWKPGDIKDFDPKFWRFPDAVKLEDGLKETIGWYERIGFRK